MWECNSTAACIFLLADCVLCLHDNIPGMIACSEFLQLIWWICLHITARYQHAKILVTNILSVMYFWYYVWCIIDVKETRTWISAVDTIWTFHSTFMWVKSRCMLAALLLTVICIIAINSPLVFWEVQYHIVLWNALCSIITLFTVFGLY